MVGQLLESNEDMSRRLRSLEEMSESQSVLTRCFRNSRGDEIVDEDDGDAATITPNDRVVPDKFTSGITGSQDSRFTFEEDLEASRVYTRTQLYKEDVSFTTSAVRTHAWSVFSGLSLAEVSVISVIALPIYADDISNSRWYTFGEAWINGLEEVAPDKVVPPLHTAVTKSSGPRHPLDHGSFGGQKTTLLAPGLSVGIPWSANNQIGRNVPHYRLLLVGGPAFGKRFIISQVSTS